MIEFSANDDPTSGTRGANSEVGTHLLTANYKRILTHSPFCPSTPPCFIIASGYRHTVHQIWNLLFKKVYSLYFLSDSQLFFLIELSYFSYFLIGQTL